MAAPKDSTAPKSEEVSWPEEKPSYAKASEGEPVETENKIINDSIMEPQQPQQSQQSPENTSFGLEMKESNRGGRNWLLIIGVVLLLLALLGGGFFFYKNMNSGEVVSATPTESPFAMATTAATPLPSVPPASKIDRASWDLEVLNGTGKSGLAATVKAKLEDMGYTVSKVGNAPDATVTKILVNKKMAADQDALLADLKSEFNVDTAGVLSDSSASARIILGKDYLK